MNHFKILSYNIHKGMNPRGTKFVLREMREHLRSIDSDVIFLQEAIGHNISDKMRIEDWPDANQIEYLAHGRWNHFAYGANKHHKNGHHGNAILSKFPIENIQNFDLTTNPFENRGLLYADLDIGLNDPLHVFCTHLNLLEGGRKVQTDKIISIIEEITQDHNPLLLCGDFNDWRKTIIDRLHGQLDLKEIFHHHQGDLIKTFPSFLPGLSLDRIFFRNLEAIEAKGLKEDPWKKLSDHLPILANFKFKE
ncbi:MAG: endonuclease/exonuclease/phosphatase family protein [Bdellovibrio sp.]